jgi:hypothetical protein
MHEGEKKRGGAPLEPLPPLRLQRGIVGLPAYPVGPQPLGRRGARGNVGPNRDPCWKNPRDPCPSPRSMFN